MGEVKKNEKMKKDFSKYQLTKKELKRLDKGLREIIKTPIKKLIRLRQERPI